MSLLWENLFMCEMFHTVKKYVERTGDYVGCLERGL